MKKLFFWILSGILLILLAGCQSGTFTQGTPEARVIVITVVVTTTPLPIVTSASTAGPLAIATAPVIQPTPEPSLTPQPSLSPTHTPEPSTTLTQAPANTPARGGRLPTPLPDYEPGRGLAVLAGGSPYALAILPGGWQAYQIGLSADRWGYLVDVTPHGYAPKGAYVESKILPEYTGVQWVDVLWLRAPGILEPLPVTVDLIPTQEWEVTFETHANLTPGDWIGWGMFDNSEGCGGVLDISPDQANQSGRTAYILNTRVQPEYPGKWIQVARVQLSNGAASQAAWLRYYAPGSLGVEKLRREAILSPDTWNGFVVGASHVRQGYVVEVMPLKKADNEVAFTVVRSESNGEWWEDVLRVYVPEGRPPLKALLRVLAVRVPGQ